MVSRAPRRVRTSQRSPTPPPIGGWNTRDEVGNMPAEDAETLDNWVPDVNSVKPRKGYEQFASGVGAGNVHTLATYVTSAGTKKFLAAGGNTIYDITSGTATQLITDQSPVPWDTVSFNNQVVFVNGGGKNLVYNGTTITEASFSLAAANKFFAAHVFKNRVFYAATNELAFWYTELFANTGTITKFPLAGIAERGGHVVAINSWTVDGGSGPDDFLAVFTSEGEVLVYQGTDPGTDFFIIGRFYVSPIVDHRSMTQVYGRLLVVTERDYIYLPDQLQTQGGGKDTKLSGAAQSVVKSFKNNSGWQAYYSANEGLTIINVPTKVDESVQHVVNVKTGAATRFTGINAKSWAEFDGDLYWGGTDGTVNKYTGRQDGTSTIPCIAIAAPSSLNSRNEKLVNAYRPRMTSNGTLEVTTALKFDFTSLGDKQTNTMQADQTTVLPVDWPWTWPDETIDFSRTEWFRGSDRGTFVQLFLRANIKNTEVSWFGNEFISEPGGILL